MTARVLILPLLLQLAPGPARAQDGFPRPLEFMTPRDRAHFAALRAAIHGYMRPPTEAELERPSVGVLVPLATEAVSTNIRVNDPTGDRSDETQDEIAAASLGPKVVAGWNDSKGFVNLMTVNTLTSFGYSTDGGLTWTDGQNLPLPGQAQGARFFGDPTLCMNRSGTVWMSTLYRSVANQNGLAVLRGTFNGSTLTFENPVPVGLSPTDQLDKPSIVCDLDHPYVYVGYGRYPPASNDGIIEVARSLDGGVSWDPGVVVQPQVTSEWMGSAMCAVSRNGDVHAFWLYGMNRDPGVQPYLLRHAVSTDHGATFSTPNLVAEVHQNWYCPPPGSNRGSNYGQVEAVAVDASGGPFDGTLYAVWEESADPVFIPASGTTSEVEPNDTPVTATPSPWPRVFAGTLESQGDVDFWSFSGNAGDMVRVIVYVTPGVNDNLRISNAPAADTLLCNSGYGPDQTNYAWVTLPSSGTYTLRLGSVGGSSSGSYSAHVERAVPRAGSLGRDHRDIAVAVSKDNGATWSTPVIVNDDLPLFDQTEPTVAVDSLGLAHVFWTDRRNDPLRGGRADVYYARSENGGATWSANVRITDNAYTWFVPSRGNPNFGDFNTATATGNEIHTFWTDGRYGNPDVFTSRVQSGFLIGCTADTTLSPGQGLAAHWTITNLSPFAETFRYTIADSLGLFASATDSVALGPQLEAVVEFHRTAPGSGTVDDPLKLSGTFRSSPFATGGCRSVVHLQGGPVAVDVPTFGTRFERLAPDPTAGRVRLSFSLARPGEVRVDLFDLGGRRVATWGRGVGSAGTHTEVWTMVDERGEALESGVYFVRANLDGKTFTSRVAVLRD